MLDIETEGEIILIIFDIILDNDIGQFFSEDEERQYEKCD